MTHAPETQPSLLVRLRNAGDERAWSQFVDLYGPLVYAYLRRQGLQDADVADLTQDVLRQVSAAVTVPGLLVGIPVAAWVLLSLMQPEVRAAFAGAGIGPQLRSDRWSWHVWRRQQFWIALACVAAGLWLVQRGGLNLSGLRSLRSPNGQSAPAESETPQPPPSFTLNHPDETLPIGRTDARQMVVSPGGALMAVAGGSHSGGFLKIWNAQTLQELALLTSPHAIHCLAFGDHGKVLATGEADGKVRVRDGRTGSVQWEIDAHGGPVTAVAFGAMSYGLVSGSEDGTLRLWQDRKSARIDLPGMSAPVLDIAITRDGNRIAAACRDRFVHFWEATGKPLPPWSFPEIPQRISLDEVDGELGVALDSGDCQVLAIKGRRTLGRWSLSGSRPTGLRTAYWKLPRVAVFITAADDGTVRLHNFTEFRTCVTLKTPSSALGADLIGAQDKIVSAHADGQLRIWNLNRP